MHSLNGLVIYRLSAYIINMGRPRTGKKVTAMIRIEPTVRAALGKKRVDRESYSSVIARLLAREQGLTDVGLQRI